MKNYKMNLHTIFAWRNKDEIIFKLQECGAIHKDREIKRPIDYCDGYFEIHLDKSRPDGALWSCSGIIRYHCGA